MNTVSHPKTDITTDDDDDQLDERSDRVSWRSLVKYLLISVGVLFALLVLFDKVIMPMYVKLGETEKVPSVIGASFGEARAKLAKLGFEVKKGEPQFSDKYPAGTVIRQLPYGGSETKQGRRIYLTLSQGSEMMPMIDLLGMPVREARIQLMRVGFDLGEIEYDYNDTIMRDLIYAQSIPPKVGARPATTVDVMVSRGPSTRFTMMPNLISLDVEQARVRLQNAGLVLGIIRYKDDPAYLPNTVIEQTISPYSQVAQGAAIDVTVASPAGGGESDQPSVSNLP
ncbi:MAG: PASTA domain-containing protein [bacterium]|nr:PASTA domain-containing protein [Candidatus Kapabacteria bacterium]